MTKLLYDTLSTKWMMRPTTISISSKEKSMMTPIFNDRILNILIAATIVQMAKMSLMNQARVSQYAIIIPNPIKYETRSSILILFKIKALLSLGLLKSQRVSEAETATPTTPIQVPTILTISAVTLTKQQAAIEPTITIALKTMRNLYPILIPNPPYDQARLYTEERVMVSVHKNIRMNRPHSNGLYTLSGWQFTKYSKSYSGDQVSTFIQLIVLPSSPHSLSIVTTQLDPAHFMLF